MNGLTLIEQRTINEVLVDGFYGNKDAWFTREQIGSALEYADPRKQIERLHSRHKERLDALSAVVKLTTTDGKAYDTYVYGFKGVLEICRWSKQPKADMVMDALYDMAMSVIEKGFYTRLSPYETIKVLAKGLDYHHFVEDHVIPLLEAQEEYSFAGLWENYCGFPINTKDDWARAKSIFNENAKERKQRMSELCYCVRDYYDDPEMSRKLSRFHWGAPENRGHYRKIKGLKWFDEYIMEQLKCSSH